ncbi:DegT/DnrJ/EryC1/StrS aminotransferase [Anaeromyxobacter sp. K]|uniref:dTDP-4-amino-4,6-dideoxygalactose transaminase n=1 Tax=Anaeromyxobacter sp. (strain K) TaxID=447217 RepID=UPI00015F856E|nr:dTDP-4-amino-4,6-dideoxygalactose transaminase [Anaeromyxobacter sp. K]ACG74104.1 DegT/DnrJ/EryC1/StrS aminotransferase [Anaeromyxobacter sp. K]
MIPFNKPVWLGTEILRITEAITTHGHVAGGGPFARACEESLARMLGQPALLVTSCTHALEMAALLLDVKEGDEFIVPSYTFVSSANAFVLRGARPVFADVDPNGNLDPREVTRLRTPRTRAVVAVHYAGSSCDMSDLLDRCGRIPLVEDAAQALGATFDGKPLGTFGVAGAISFHETKNVGCGEGGALTVADPALLERAEYLRDKGTNRRRFLTGLVDKYTWVDVGSSYALSDLNAAYLSAQLDAFERIQARRATLHDRYVRELERAVERKGGYLVRPDPRNRPNHHLLGLVLRAREQRDRFIAHMKAHGITTPFHYVALHLSPMGKRFHGGEPLPGAERLTDCLVRLPLFFNMTDAEQDEVIARTLEFVDGL